jgi:hypothetical protein
MHHLKRSLRISRAYRPSLNGKYELTKHLHKRMHRRGLSLDAVSAVLTYGRCVYARGARVFAIGRREAEAFAHEADLEPYRGVQVVCDSGDDVVMTIYRNRDFSALRAS